MGAQTCFDMSHRDLRIKRCEGGGCRSSGVSMHQYYIGTTLLKHISHACQHARCNISKVLPLLHDVKIEIRRDIKDTEHLIKHLSMLTGNAYHGLKRVGMFLKLLNERAHLDRLGASAKHKHYFLHQNLMIFNLLKTLVNEFFLNTIYSLVIKFIYYQKCHIA